MYAHRNEGYILKNIERRERERGRNSVSTNDHTVYKAEALLQLVINWLRGLLGFTKMVKACLETKVGNVFQLLIKKNAHV